MASHTRITGLAFHKEWIQGVPIDDQLNLEKNQRILSSLVCGVVKTSIKETKNANVWQCVY